jgi:hypothetical protein
LPSVISPAAALAVNDGFRVIARKNGARVTLYSRAGNDLTKRFPLIADAIARLWLRADPPLGH